MQHEIARLAAACGLRAFPYLAFPGPEFDLPPPAAEPGRAGIHGVEVGPGSEPAPVSVGLAATEVPSAGVAPMRSLALAVGAAPACRFAMLREVREVLATAACPRPAAPRPEECPAG